MTIPLYQVDAFAEGPFTGNPAAVCFPSSFPDAAWMQAVALEMQLSETAFLVSQEPGTFALRWFTPAIEVKLCGHATLASAHVLWETGRAEAGQTIRFSTLSGILTATPADGGIELDFPATPLVAAPPPDGLLDSLGLTDGVVSVTEAGPDFLLRLTDEAAVRAVAPDFRALSSIGVRCVMVTAEAARGSDLDFVSRYFAPGSGIDEDPVTGSAHCALGPFWQRELGRPVLRAAQLSTRGGRLEVEPAGDRVRLRGRAVTVLRGELLAAPAANA